LIQARGPVEQLILYERVDPPVGSIVAYTVNNSPTGWLLCNGSSVNKETYPALYEAIGNTFGGLETDLSFNLPNYQGAFLRGIGTNPTNEYTGPTTVSTPQAHATQTHNHTATSTVTDGQHTHTQNAHTHTASTVITDPGHVHSQTTNQDDYNGSAGSPPGFFTDSGGPTIIPNINRSTTGITAATSVDPETPTINNASSNITVSTTIGNSTTNVANETRPYNYGVYWIIKY